MTLKKFLELPNVFSSIKAYIDKCRQSENFVSVIQSDLWKEPEKRLERKDVLPFEIYFDDHEINNALGSHKGDHEIGRVYGSIACLPKEYSSMLENILFLQLHYTIDHKCLGNYPIFSHLIDQLIDLEVGGIEINVGGQIRKVYFALIDLLADNLGAHLALGFTKGFNSTYPCICLATKANCQKMVEEDTNLLRTKESYEKHSTDLSHGVTESCIFNRIPNFVVIKNSILDFQHDVPIGVCRYDITKILKCLISAKLFSSAVFNSRLTYFDFGTNCDINIPPEITENNLQVEYSIQHLNSLLKNITLFIYKFSKKI